MEKYISAPNGESVPRDARLRSGMTQGDVAKGMGATTSAVCQLEQRPPEKWKLCRLVEYANTLPPREAKAIRDWVAKQFD